MNKEKILFKTPFGSHLYGTATETSDLDFKIVTLPGLEELIMNGRLSNRVEKPDGWVEGARMNAGTIEQEYIPLQVFLDQFFDGQTYALEIAFAVLSGKFTHMEDEKFTVVWMNELVSRFLTSSVKKMVGYAINQASQYGLKTRRYTSLIQLQTLYRQVEPTGKLVDSVDVLNEMVKIPYVERSVIMNANGGTEPADAITIAGKQFPLTSRWSHLIKVIDGMIESYGNRVKDHLNEPVDWKALSHAIRITEQIIELVTTHKLSFPRPNASFLLDVKNGKIPLKSAMDYLTSQFNLIDPAVEQSALPERTEELEAEFVQFKLSLLRSYYNLS